MSEVALDRDYYDHVNRVARLCEVPNSEVRFHLTQNVEGNDAGVSDKLYVRAHVGISCEFTCAWTVRIEWFMLREPRHGGYQWNC